MIEDAAHIQFLTIPRAELKISLKRNSSPKELQFFGNRPGLLSLAHVLHWLDFNSHRREILAASELPFVKTKLRFFFRLVTDLKPEEFGTIHRRKKEWEWCFCEDQVRRITRVVNQIAFWIEHEYWKIGVSEFEIHFRMIDVRSWL